MVTVFFENDFIFFYIYIFLFYYILFPFLIFIYSKHSKSHGGLSAIVSAGEPIPAYFFLSPEFRRQH